MISPLGSWITSNTASGLPGSSGGRITLPRILARTRSIHSVCARLRAATCACFARSFASDSAWACSCCSRCACTRWRVSRSACARISARSRCCRSTRRFWSSAFLISASRRSFSFSSSAWRRRRSRSTSTSRALRSFSARNAMSAARGSGCSTFGSGGFGAALRLGTVAVPVAALAGHRRGCPRRRRVQLGGHRLGPAVLPRHREHQHADEQRC